MVTTLQPHKSDWFFLRTVGGGVRSSLVLNVTRKVIYVRPLQVCDKGGRFFGLEVLRFLKVNFGFVFEITLSFDVTGR